MKHATTVVLALLLLTPLASAQSLVDVKEVKSPGDAARKHGIARPRIADQAVGRSDGRLPGTPRIENGPTGIPELDEGNHRDPRSGGAPGSGRNPAASGVRLVKHEVDVRITDGVAITTIDQTFHNVGVAAVEGTWLHELPRGSVIDGFSIFMAGAEVRGGVYERNEGRRLYDEIVNKKKDPGIVELLPGESPRIKARIFPIPAGGEFRVKTRYTHAMAEQRGTYSTCLPFRELVGSDADPIPELGVSLRARAAWPLASVRAPEFDFRGLEDGPRRNWLGTFAAKNFRPEHDLSIRCIPHREKPDLALYVHTTPDGERYFMAVVTAGLGKLRDAKLDFGKLETGPCFPAGIPALEPGRQTLVFGRLLGTRAAVGRLRGMHGGEAVDIRATAPEVASRDATRFVASMWAEKRVRELISAAERGKSTLKTGEVVALSVRYGILTPYTVFFAR